MTIQILDEQLANKIAAGEVIERPASVVKELVENAIDAGATDIEVVIEEAGRKLIRVTDNGSGMTREDTVLSLQRHATSKISTTDDLFHIRTLGFRGEALPSIASVSYLRMTSRRAADAAGVEMEAVGGVIQDLRETGCPSGTQIAISQLFYNTPARLKFLKSDQAEMAQISDQLNAFSLCHHHLHLRLLHNGNEILQRPSSNSMLAQISAWLGRKTAEAMVELNLSSPGLQIDGYVGKTEAARGNRGGQLFFLNGRRITNRMLTHALEFAYQGMLLPRQFPVAVVRLNIDPGEVDVNVHPAKAEVRFNNDNDIHAAVVRAVKNALSNQQMIQQLAVWQPSTGKAANAFTPTGQQLSTLDFPNDNAAGNHYRPLASIPATEGVALPVSGLRAIGQFHGIFLLAEGRDALLVINQHRAHERVIFERLWANYSHIDSQRLILPVNIHLSSHDAMLLDNMLDELTAFGFEIAPMSGQSYLIRAVPAMMAGQNPENIIHDIIFDVDAGINIAQFNCDDPKRKAIEEGRRRILASLACHSAVKAGKIMTGIEQTELLDKLQATSQPAICPHGGPIIMTISQYELDKKFTR